MVCSPRLLEGDHPLKQPEDLRHQTLIHDESIPVVDMRPSWREWLKLANVSGVDSERGPRFSNSLMALEAALEGQGVALALQPLIENRPGRRSPGQAFRDQHAVGLCLFPGNGKKRG